ncbi:ribonuclease H-like domain-containing protein [Tanacetum coccineum]
MTEPEPKKKSKKEIEQERLMDEEESKSYVCSTSLEDRLENASFCHSVSCYNDETNGQLLSKGLDFNHILELCEHGSEKMKSPEKIEEKDVDTQKEMKEEVIENENSWVPIPVTTPPETGTSTTTKMIVPGTIEEKTCRKNDVKERSLLLMALPNEHQLTFDHASSSASLDSIFNRLQKLVSRLAILGVVTPPEDLNVKFLRSLPSECDTHVVVWMNKPDFDTIGLDDLYNNFKIVEQKVKKSVGASNNDKNLAFVTTSGASSTNNINTVNPEVSTATTKVNTASTEICTASFSDATIYAFLSTQPKGSQLVHEDLEQLHDDDLEEMDLKWNMALLSMRARKFYQRTGRKIIIDGSNTAGYDKSKVECFNCHKMGHFARECKAPRSKDNINWNQVCSTKTVKIKDASKKAMCAIDGAGFDWSDVAEEEIQPNMALMAFSDSEYGPRDSSLKPTTGCDKESDNSKENTDDSLEQHQMTDTETSSFESPLKVDKDWKEKFFYPANHVESVNQIEKPVKRTVRYADKSLVKEQESQVKSSFVEGCGSNTSKNVSEVEPKKVRKNNDAPIIEDWVLDDEEQDGSKTKPEKKTVIPTAAKIEKPVRKPVKYAEMYSLNEDWPKIFNTARPVNTVRSVNTGRPFSNARSFNTVRPSYTAHPKSTIHYARPRTYFQNQAQSTVHRPFYKRTALTERCFNQRFNTGRPFRSTVNTVRARGFNAVKPSACWVWRPVKPNGASLVFNKYNYIDARGRSNGCSSHMTGNIAHLSDFKDFDGGYVTFGGGAYGDRITGKGTIKTDNLDFDDVYFVKELKFNLFSVVLFTDSECLVLSPNFKFPDENQILLKIPRQDNMYSFDMKNIVPKDGLTCLVAKATYLWSNQICLLKDLRMTKLVFHVLKASNTEPLDNKRVSESSTSSQQDQDNQDCIVMPIWKDASYFGDAAPRSVADAQIQDKDSWFALSWQIRVEFNCDPRAKINPPIIKENVTDRLKERVEQAKCMRTRSQARNRNRRQQQITTVIVEEPEIPMADNRTMAQMLQAPTVGYEDAIVVPEINADNFELKHSLITLVQNK